MEKNITSKKMTVNYIISWLVWGFLASLTLVPLSEVIVEEITYSIIGITETNFNNVTGKIYIGVIIIAILSIIFSVLINYCVNIIATNSSLNKVKILDEERATKLINNVTIFHIITSTLWGMLNLYLEAMTWIMYIVLIVKEIITIIIIRKYIRNRTNKIIQNN